MQVIITGISIGAVYSLMGLGYTITYNSLRLLNFAQGDMYMLGAVFGLMFVNMGVPFYLSILLGGLVAAFFGILMNRFIFKPLRGFPVINLIIATIGISTTIRASALQIWGSAAMAYPRVYSADPIHIGPVQIMPSYLTVILVSAAVIIALQFFLSKTKLGKALRATAQNRNAALLMGIPVTKMDMFAAAISAFLGGIGGVLVGPIFYVETEMGAMAGLKGFSAAVLGGFGSVPGAILGGVVLGLSESLGASFISTAYKDAIAFIILIAVLLFMPNGILGGKGKKVKKI